MSNRIKRRIAGITSSVLIVGAALNPGVRNYVIDQIQMIVGDEVNIRQEVDDFNKIINVDDIQKAYTSELLTIIDNPDYIYNSSDNNYKVTEEKAIKINDKLFVIEGLTKKVSEATNDNSEIKTDEIINYITDLVNSNPDQYKDIIEILKTER